MNPAPVIFQFKLYIVGDAVNSTIAVSNLNALCREYLPDRHHIETVDVLLHPMRALNEGILLTPTLIVFFPGPVRRIVGTLTDSLVVLQTLGLLVPPL
jgi:circadian clock protein KaiB